MRLKYMDFEWFFEQNSLILSFKTIFIGSMQIVVKLNHFGLETKLSVMRTPEQGVIQFNQVKDRDDNLDSKEEEGITFQNSSKIIEIKVGKDKNLRQEENKAQLQNPSKENRLRKSNRRLKQDLGNNQIGNNHQKQKVMEERKNHQAER